MNINVSDCTFTIELDKELEKLKTAEALHVLAQKTLLTPSAPMLHIGETK